MTKHYYSVNDIQAELLKRHGVKLQRNSIWPKLRLHRRSLIRHRVRALNNRFSLPAEYLDEALVVLAQKKQPKQVRRVAARADVLPKRKRPFPTIEAAIQEGNKKGAVYLTRDGEKKLIQRTVAQ